MDTKRLRVLVQDCMDRAVEECETAGCLFCLLEDGRELLYLESGYADRESGRRMSRDAVFRLYSMTKPVTAAAFLKLVQEGQADLCDPVGRYLAGFRDQSCLGEDGRVHPVPADRPMQLRDLLNMTSGLVYPEETSLPGRETDAVMQELISRLGQEQAMTTAEFADRIGRCTLLFAPGTGWRYGVSADILGAVTESITGAGFAEFMGEAILRPAGMTQTGFTVPEGRRNRLVTAYERREEASGAVLIPYRGCHLGIRNDGGSNPFASGGAGLFSTMDDMILFTQMLLRGGVAEDGTRVLQEGTVRYLSTGRLSAQQQRSFDDWPGLDGYSYGNLNRVLVEPGRAVTFGSRGEYGWDGWLGTYFTNDPAHRRTLLLLLNQKDFGTGRLTRQLRNLVFAE